MWPVSAPMVVVIGEDGYPRMCTDIHTLSSDPSPTLSSPAIHIRHSKRITLHILPAITYELLSCLISEAHDDLTHSTFGYGYAKLRRAPIAGHADSELKDLARKRFLNQMHPIKLQGGLGTLIALAFMVGKHLIDSMLELSAEVPHNMVTLRHYLGRYQPAKARCSINELPS